MSTGKTAKGIFSDPELRRRFHKRKEQEDSKIYFVSHYSTPHRAAKLKPPAIHKVTSVTNLTCASSRTPAPLGNLRCSRSLSLQDLSPAFHASLSRRRARICSKVVPSPPLTSMSGNEETVSEQQRILAYKAFSRFLKNALRKKCEDSEIKDITLRSANGQIAHLKIQLSSLKNILKSDEQVISGSFREISNLKNLLAKLQEEYNSCKKDKEEARGALETAKDELHDVRTESYNDKNSLMLAKSEAAALEAQLEKERQKIAKLKNENKALHEKAGIYAKNLENKTEKINRLSENVDQLEKQISSYTELLRNSEIRIEQEQRYRALEEASGCLRGLKKELGDAISREGRLRAQLDEASFKMREQANHYNKLIKEQTMSIVRLETEVAMKQEDPLRSKVVKMMTSALNVPLVFAMALTRGQGF